MKQSWNIWEIEEDFMYPHCPDCSIPLYLERRVYSEASIQTQKQQRECNHDWGNDYGYSHPWTCKKCGYYEQQGDYPLDAREMRCPKCGKLFHVESKRIDGGE